MPPLTEAQREKKNERKILTQRIHALKLWEATATPAEREAVGRVLVDLMAKQADIPIIRPSRPEPPSARK